MPETKQRTMTIQKEVDLDNARVEEQRQVMQKILDAGEDPFSMENLKKYHKKPILKEGKFWVVTENQWPYDNKKNHLLFIHKENIYSLSEVTPDAYAELLTLAQEIEKDFEFSGGALCMRFGSSDSSGATVRHMHAQMIEPIEGTAIKYYIGKENKQ